MKLMLIWVKVVMLLAAIKSYNVAKCLVALFVIT